MKNSIFIITFLSFLIAFSGCKPAAEQAKTADIIKNDLRAPAYPLVAIDPYTSAWSFSDRLYDESVKHWTGEKFPFMGVIRVDGNPYRFMGMEDIPLLPIVSTGESNTWTGKYTFTKPAAGWEKPDFNDSQWKEGKAPFGSEEEITSKTRWEKTPDIWVRREINLEEDLAGKTVFLEYSHDDDVEIYINGIEVVNTGNACKKNVALTLEESVKQSLKKGKNIITAHCHDRGGLAFLDFGLSTEAPVKKYFETTAQQKSADVQATQTRYQFTCGPVDLDLTFTSPLLLNDLELISRPVNYISYEIKSTDGKDHEVEIYFEAAPNWALDKPSQESQALIEEKEGLVFLRTGSVKQDILGKKGDNVRIDWGYFYLSGQKADNCSYLTGNPDVLRNSFVESGKLSSTETSAQKQDHLATVQSLGKVNKPVNGNIMIGYDDIYSIQYFGDNLRPYWNADGSKNIYQIFAQAAKDYSKLKSDCDQFDYELMTQAIEDGGKEYASLCALAYRQAIAAHKLVKAPNGDLLFLSKENFSNGSIGTVDITYPSAPMFLLYNTELAKGLLNHIFYYSESGKWPKPFAAHDVGTYPLANGQTYGGDMPVEESGNMLITTAAIAAMEGNADYASKHWETLTIWTDYLVEKGLDPENQLCTDDFAGHFAHNANLSIKAILGIASYGRLAEMLGKQDVAMEYTNKAKNMAAEWVKMADDGDHYRLTFDQPGTWSQKYNLVWDKLLNLGIFPTTVAEKEIPFYLTKQNIYGLPLDNRETYTKADWIIWSATLAPDKATFEKFVSPIYKFMNETTDRVPMTDWYFTDSPKQRGFQARSVVGGFFIKSLEKKIVKN